MFSDRAAQYSRELLAHEGIEYTPGKHIDCPLCEAKGKARIVFSGVSIDGGAWVCNGCTEGAYKPILDLCIRHSGKDFKTFADEVEQAGIVPAGKIKPKPPRKPRHAFKFTGQPLQHSRYLSNRGLICVPGLRFGFTEDEGERWPAMVADVHDNRGELIGRHFTFLQDGRKRANEPARKYQKRFEDSPTVGHVRLMGHRGILGVAEGIETAIAASMLNGVPCWACLDARQLAGFQPPQDVKVLRIFGDNDRSGTGQAAAWTLYKRIYCSQARRKGLIAVEFPLFPLYVGQDWNDVLRQEAAA